MLDWSRNKLQIANQIIRWRVHHYGPARKFRKFEASVHPMTWSRHDELLSWAEAQVAVALENETMEFYQASDDPVVRQGFELTRQVKQHFKDRCREYKQLRFLIHVPPAVVSSAGFSLFTNLIQSLRFLGLAVRELGWNDDTRTTLEHFQPTVLLTSDHEGYLSRIDWEIVRDYRQSRCLKVGLTTSLDSFKRGQQSERFAWAEQHGVDFYYSFHAPQYVQGRYHAYIERGYQIFHLEFGANPLIYYPVPGIERDLNYVFLGSTNPDKWPRYYAYFGALWEKYPGFIDGPWWQSITRFGDALTHRYLCARAKVALNLHIQSQIDRDFELNERTYNLAACGVPQLMDAPKLLFERFQPDSFFVADTPAEYEALFKRILSDAEEARRRALQAQREVFACHTVFHRAESFVTDLLSRGVT
jgi:hypothetical protein